MKQTVTQAERKEAKNIRVYSYRTATQRESKFYKPYNELAKSIENKFLKANEEDLREYISEEIDNTFTPLMQTALFNVWELNIDQFVDYFVNNFDRNINTDEIQTIKSDMLKKFSDDYMAKKVTSISETTENILNTRISKYTEEGLSFRDMTRKIVEDTKGEIKKTRAELIAREETSQAIAGANHQTAKSAGFKYKKWIHAGGGKTNRENHLAMDGVIVKINEKFSVPGSGSCPPTKLNTPKDPNSNVACQIINCYCTVRYTNKA